MLVIVLLVALIQVMHAVPLAAPSSSGEASGSAPIQGKASYYTEWKSNAGSCGTIPGPTEDICAVPPSYMGASKRDKCGQCVLVEYAGKPPLKVKVTDTCPGCDSTKIDLADTTFKKLADDLGKGIIDIKWSFVPC